MPNDNANYHPLDVTQLQKGQVLSVELLESVIGCSSFDKRWPLKVLVQLQRIEKLRSGMGLPVLTMRIRHGTIVICDDSEAATYNRSMGRRGIKRFARASYRNLAVDASKLTQEDATAHSRTLLRQAMTLSAIRSAAHRKLPELGEQQRATPKMVCVDNKQM